MVLCVLVMAGAHRTKPGASVSESKSLLTITASSGLLPLTASEEGAELTLIPSPSARMRERVVVLTLSVSHSTADLEDIMPLD